MSDGPDMEARDANDINAHVKVSFEEVFGEPDGVHSIDGVWKCSYKCFNGTVSICYKILTVLCAVPFAFCWGCDFACTAFCHIWYCTPWFRILSIDLVAVRKIITLCLEVCIVPFCESCGYLFSKITVQQNS